MRHGIFTMRWATASHGSLGDSGVSCIPKIRSLNANHSNRELLIAASKLTSLTSMTTWCMLSIASSHCILTVSRDLHWRKKNLLNKYVGPPYCQTKMYAGCVTCCPLVSHDEYALCAVLRSKKDGTSSRMDKQTYRQTSGCHTDASHLPLNAANIMTKAGFNWKR